MGTLSGGIAVERLDRARGQALTPVARRRVVLALLLAAMAVLVWRAVDLQLKDQAFLRGQGEARHMRVVPVPAHRGMITDRHGDPLAISTPVDSVWANPQEFAATGDSLAQLGGVLGLSVDYLRRQLAGRGGREFVYLKRHIDPATSSAVSALKLPGIALQREYRRYYPAGEVTGHLLGFTNIDDVGQEGIELAFEEHLRAETGSKRVIKDRLGHVIAEVGQLREARPGGDLALSIDRRIQYIAYRALKAAVLQHNARSGSAVVLDVRTGEVLAMVNQPSFNPNNRRGLNGGVYRNRAVTDLFEPGSTVKPFTIAAALASGKYRPDTPIDTRPGRFRVGRLTVTDFRNYGEIDVTAVLTKSSNVGAAKIALDLPKEQLWGLFDRIGFGRVTESAFPGEATGQLTHHRRWKQIEVATLAYGYGLSVTPLQLASAYAALANDGVQMPVTLIARQESGEMRRVFAADTARQVRSMLETVVAPGGTGTLAAVAGYRVAGKTGTVRKPVPGGYAEDKYMAIFAGMAPASDPRLVTVVMVNEPRVKDYYGGLVAAPVFSQIMAGALRLVNASPDDPRAWEQQVAFAPAGAGT